MVKRNSNNLFDVYTRDGKILIASDVDLEEAISLECKCKDPTPKWVQDIERKKDEVWKNKLKKP